ncbi:non-homologous end joining protein Ku [Streptomyces barringtoniae]|uniref:non-homologous end joining protein Ku n=1 Tax=Streptomyces barringtoniae TaxID=2892029 RepID=UPI001E651C29|nr:Ku protein [Streptomyces barringtoniae]MCC5481065.1 Ku protein [Streptomyces barringtoniae]
MPRTIWSGAISFGLVSVPINVVGATEDHSIRFHQYHLEDMGHVRYRKACELEDREVDQSEIGKGYELSKTQVIPITDEELSNLPLPTAKAIEIDAFVPLDSIDPLKIAEGYYLQPSSPVAAKPYKLLVQALGRSSKVAVAKYAWSGRGRLGLLRIRDDVLVLHAMRWPDEIRDPTELLPPPVEVSEQEIEGALALMDTMTVDELVGPDFEDRYTEAMAQIIEAKRGEKPLPEAPAPLVRLLARGGAFSVHIQHRVRRSWGRKPYRVRSAWPRQPCGGTVCPWRCSCCAGTRTRWSSTRRFPLCWPRWAARWPRSAASARSP